MDIYEEPAWTCHRGHPSQGERGTCILSYAKNEYSFSESRELVFRLRLTWKLKIMTSRLESCMWGGSEVNGFMGLDTCKLECLMNGVQVHELPTLRFRGELTLNLKIWDVVIWTLVLKY